MKLLTTLFLFLTLPLVGEEAKSPIREELVETIHTLSINGKDLHYKAFAGTLPYKTEKGEEKGHFFYTAFIKDAEPGTAPNTPSTRPIAFCFNGGPGSAAVWLNLGAFGPKRIVLKDLEINLSPYRIEDNPYSLLDQIDLVFIDPISTGYSRPAPGEDPKQFHGVDEDTRSVAEFIRLYTTRNNRWNSSKLLIGESYGATRACVLASYLHDSLNLEINGIILVSSILNFQTINEEELGNDVPSIVFLPSFAATAWYHKKLDPKLQQLKLETFLKEVELFAISEYAPALALGDLLEGERKKQVIQRLAAYTSLTPEQIERTNLRVCQNRFCKELLRKEMRVIGRFDGRCISIDPAICGEGPTYDPSMENVLGAFNAAFNTYVRTNLNWVKDDPYWVLANVSPWDWGRDSFRSFNVTEGLKILMSKNPKLKIFVASGYFDLATPYFGTLYTFRHLALDPTICNNVQMGFYPAGHMMYLDPDSAKKLKGDLTQFLRPFANSP